VETRLARIEDAPAIREIYNLEVLESTVTFDLMPRSLEEQETWLAERNGAHCVVVVLDRDVLVGFASLSPYRMRPAYNTTVESSIYIHRDHQRRGVGRLLLAELLSAAAAHGFHSVMARIVGGHKASIALHEAAGFRVVGVEREVGRKFGRWQDVVLMQHMVTETPAATEAATTPETRGHGTATVSDEPPPATEPALVPGDPASPSEPSDEPVTRAVTPPLQPERNR